MRILLISYTFPPYSFSGSVRLGGLYQFLCDHGHDVRVVAAQAQGVAREANANYNPDEVRHVSYRSLESILLKIRERLKSQEKTSAVKQSASRSSGFWIRQIRAIFAWPDGQAGWIRPALKIARNITRNWSPDIIISSALPFSGHCVAGCLQHDLGVPWIADYRDLFTGNPYNKLPWWRGFVNKVLEKKVMARVTHLTTVSQPLADELHELHTKPTSVILSGYDGSGENPAAGLLATRSKPIRILYSGIIYPGKRDPGPLFEAISHMNLGPDEIKVSFYGQDLRGVQELANKHRVEQCVEVKPSIPREEILKLQSEADVLLLLLWDDPQEEGVYTGKMFEYIAAQRPILCIGCKDGVAARMVRDRRLGVAVSKPLEVVQALEKWIQEFDANQEIASIHEESRRGLSREDQFRLFDELIQQIGGSNK